MRCFALLFSQCPVQCSLLDLHFRVAWCLKSHRFRQSRGEVVNLHYKDAISRQHKYGKLQHSLAQKGGGVRYRLLWMMILAWKSTCQSKNQFVTPKHLEKSFINITTVVITDDLITIIIVVLLFTLELSTMAQMKTT